MSGKKLDEGKVPLSLVPKALLEGVAWVLDFGAKKYGRDNYKQGFKYTRLADAILRHMSSAVDGEDFDSESGRLHLEHAAATLGMLLECLRLGTLKDDRYHGEEEGTERSGTSTGTNSVIAIGKQGITQGSESDAQEDSAARLTCGG